MLIMLNWHLSKLMKECKLHRLAVQRAAWRAQEELVLTNDSSDEETVRNKSVQTERVQPNQMRAGEVLKEQENPGGWKSEEDNGSKESQHAYVQVMSRIKRVQKDYHSALLSWNNIQSIDQKREKFLKLGR